jgi:hypothetical protein
MNLRAASADTIGIALDETTTRAEVEALWAVFAKAGAAAPDFAALEPSARGPDSGESSSHLRVSGPSGVQRLSLGNRDAALPALPRRPRSGAGPLHDPARFLHHEAERHHGNDPDHLAGVRQPAPVRAISIRPRAMQNCSRAGADAGGLHRLRRGVAPAQRRFTG